MNREPRSTMQVSVAGLVLDVHAGRHEDLELMRRIVGSQTASGAPDAVIDIRDEIPAMPPGRADFEGPYGDHWDDGSTHHFFHHWGLGAVVDRGSALVGASAEGFERWVALRNSMLFILARLFLERDRFLVHGAGLRRSGEGVLVVGDSGTGKSTLAYAAGRAGWSVLGDDMVVVTPAVPTPSIQGVQRVPSLPGDVAEQVAAVGSPVPRDDRRRIELDSYGLDHRDTPVSTVVICGHHSTGGSIGALDAATALEHLVPAFVFSALEEPVRRWFPIAVGLAKGRCMELHHASRPAQRLERAAVLLGDATR